MIQTTHIVTIATINDIISNHEVPTSIIRNPHSQTIHSNDTNSSSNFGEERKPCKAPSFRNNLQKLYCYQHIIMYGQYFKRGFGLNISKNL